MRIIIETDGGVKPQIQMNEQVTENLESKQGAPAISVNAIDAGPPKVGTGQPSSSTSPIAESSSPQSDTNSGGSAPKDL